MVKSKDLPLHHFDKLFRTIGSLLLFALWGVRAGATRLLPRHFDRASTLLWVPLGIYLGQAVIRMAIYQLHVAGGCLAMHTGIAEAAGGLPALLFFSLPLVDSRSLSLTCPSAAADMWHPHLSILSLFPAGYIFTPQRWARDNLSHPPHVMSDHVLLASAVHGGLASEALLPLLNWWHTKTTGEQNAAGGGVAEAGAAGGRRARASNAVGCCLGRIESQPAIASQPTSQHLHAASFLCWLPQSLGAGHGRTFLRLYSAAAGALAILVSAECYFTVGGACCCCCSCCTWLCCLDCPAAAQRP